MRGRYRRHFFFSYVMIVIPSFLIFTLFTSGLFLMLRDQIRSSLQAELDEVVNKFELQFQAYEMTSLNLRLNNNIVPHKIDIGKSSSIQVIQILQGIARQDLMTYDVFLTLDGETIYSSFGMSSLHTYMTRNLYLSNASILQAFASITADKSENSVSFFPVGTGDGVYLFHHSVPLDRGYDPVSVNYVIKQDAFGSLLQPLSRGYSSYCQINLPGGERIVYVEDAQNGKFVSASGMDFDEMVGGLSDYDVLRTVSSRTGTIFFTAYRPSALFRQITVYQVLAFVSLAVFLLLALLTSYRFSERNAAPIQEMVRKFADNVSEGTTNGKDSRIDEITYIRTMIGVTIDENRRMNKILDDSHRIQNEQSILLLLHNLSGHNGNAVFPLEENYFCVAIVCPCSQIHIDSEQIGKWYEILLCTAGFEAVCRETVANRSVLTLLLGMPNKDAQKNWRRTFEGRLRDALEISGVNLFYLAFSRVYDVADQLSQAHREAVYVISTGKGELANGAMAFFEDIVSFDLFALSPTKQESEGFQRAVSKLSRDGISTQFEQLMTRMNPQVSDSRTAVSYRYSILNLFLRSIVEMKIDDQFYSEILSIDPSDETVFRRQINKIFDKLCIQEKIPEDDSFSRILQYIHNNYADANLTLEEVASHSDLSNSYVSRLFKAKTGKRYIDYLTEIRMEETKRLLSDTDMSLREIVQRVGYCDVTSFHKKFKSLYGISPAKYREHHSNTIE